MCGDMYFVSCISCTDWKMLIWQTISKFNLRKRASDNEDLTGWILYVNHVFVCFEISLV